MARSFSGRLVLSLIIVTIIESLVILSASYIVASYIIMENMLNLNQSRLDYLSQQYTNTRKSLDNLLSLSADSRLEGLVDQIGSQDGNEASRAVKSAQQQLSLWMQSEPALSDIYLVTAGRIITARGDAPVAGQGADPSPNALQASLRDYVKSAWGEAAWNNVITSALGKHALIAGLFNNSSVVQSMPGQKLCIFDAGHTLVYGEGVSYSDIFDPSLRSYFSRIYAEPAPAPSLRTDTLFSRLLGLAGVDAISLGGRYYLVNMRYTYETKYTFVLLIDLEQSIAALGPSAAILCWAAVGLAAVFTIPYIFAGRFAVGRIARLRQHVSRAGGGDGISVLDAFLERNRRQSNIRRNITACFILPFLPMCLLVALSFALYAPILAGNAKDEMQTTIEQMASNVENRIREADGVAYRIAADGNLEQALLESMHGLAVSPERIAPILIRNGAQASVIRKVEIYDATGRLLYATDANAPERMPAEAAAWSDGAYYSFDTVADATGQGWVAVRAGADREDATAGSIIGYVGLGLNEVFDTTPANGADFVNGYRYIYDKAKWALVCTPLSTPYRNLVEGMSQAMLYGERQLKLIDLKDGKEARYYYFSPIHGGRWLFVFSFPSSYITKNNYNILFYGLLTVLVSLAASVFTSWALERQLVGRIVKLASGCADARNNGDGLSQHWGNDEIGMLAAAFRELLDNTKDLMQRINRTQLDYYKLEHHKKDLELTTIQMKMNPHFLYNIFTSINVLLASGETALASGMLSAAGRFMRLSLMGKEIEVSLEKEMEFARAYIELEKMRYPGRIQVDIRYDTLFAAHFNVPRLILQPLIENAILHGMPANRPLRMDISVLEEAGRVVIRVCDDGTGIDDATMGRLNGVLSGDAQTDQIGLACIHERIRIYYGDKYGLSIHRPETGRWATCVEIVLPAQETEAEGIVQAADR